MEQHILCYSARNYIFVMILYLFVHKKTFEKVQSSGRTGIPALLPWKYELKANLTRLFFNFTIFDHFSKWSILLGAAKL